MIRRKETRKMTKNLPILLIVSAALLTIGLSTSLFTVEQTKQAIVLQFGELKKVHDAPGLKIKIPFIQEVIYYEKRVLDYDLPPILINTGDRKRLIVDTYTRYRISNPLLFFQSVQPAAESGARMRLETMINSVVRNVIGKTPLRNLLTEERSKIMKLIEEEVKISAKPLGIEIVDVRIIRTELPPENRNAVFAKMNSELDRIAKENRAKGAETAQGIRSRAERDRTVLLAEAQKKSQILRGEGDGAAMKIAAETFGKDPEFYGFYRTMETYRESLGAETSLVLSTDSDLFRLFTHAPKIQSARN